MLCSKLHQLSYTKSFLWLRLLNLMLTENLMPGKSLGNRSNLPMLFHSPRTQGNFALECGNISFLDIRVWGETQMKIIREGSKGPHWSPKISTQSGLGKCSSCQSWYLLQGWEFGGIEKKKKERESRNLYLCPLCDSKVDLWLTSVERKSKEPGPQEKIEVVFSSLSPYFLLYIVQTSHCIGEETEDYSG